MNTHAPRSSHAPAHASATHAAHADDLAALAAYAAHRDPDAFAAIVHRYQSMVLATCVRTLGAGAAGLADAEDATQETFLRLARAAGAIRSNAAAWLHACAVRTSVDLLRRRGATARAERASAAFAHPSADRAADDPADHPAQRADDADSWAHIKPLLDRAMLALNDADRELIVQRYLCGRSEPDLARELGVAAGTVHRRAQRALDRLRDHLRRAGLNATAAAALAGALALVEPVPVSAAVTASALQVGVAGITASSTAAAPAALTASAGLSVVSVPTLLTAAGALSLALVTGAALYLGGAFTAPQPPAPAPRAAGAPLASTAPAPAPAAAPLPTPRPTRDEGPFLVASALLDGQPNSALRCTADQLELQLYRDQRGTPRGITFRIDAASARSSRADLTLTVLATTLEFPDAPASLLGKTTTGSVTIDNDRVSLQIKSPFPGDEGSMTWSGVKDPAPQPPQRPSTSQPPAADAPAPLPTLVGTWLERPSWSVRLSADEIIARDGDTEVMRFRILDWTPGQDFATVSVLCVRHYDPARIGERFRMLVRKTPDGYDVAVPDGPNANLAKPPHGFDPRPNAGVAVFILRQEAR